MTNRENVLAAYKHEIPESIPNFFTDYDVWDSFGERYFGEGTGEDWFGVNWTYLPEHNNSQMITPGQPELEDLTNWRDNIKIPDLTAYNWEAIAKETTKNWDRKNKVSLCMLLNGPSERMISIMGFENALYAFYDYPEEVHELFQAITDHKIKYLEILKKYFSLILLHTMMTGVTIKICSSQLVCGENLLNLIFSR